MKHGPRQNRRLSAAAKGVPTSDSCSVGRGAGERSKVGKQMMAQAGAPTDDAHKWEGVNWDRARRVIRRLQLPIAKAVKAGPWNKVRVLQRLLTRSFYAKLLAVKRVTSNKGRKTPGVDGVLWQGARAKWRAACSLRQRGYRPQLLRRIYIPKNDGKKRPNSYGFREGRSCADAIAAACNALSKPNSATWILEGDITGCYDNILRKWLTAGYVEDNRLYPTRKGKPQGGIISPCLSDMTLDGLERVVRDAVPRRSRVNFVRYADDFIITGKSRRLLEEQVKPAVEAFLTERGLTLSEEKTSITHIKHGFTFLGQTFRKHGNVLHITPATEGVRALVQKVGTWIREHASAPAPVLVKALNQTLRGWGNYHRHVVASDAFSRIDKYIYEQLWRMLRRRHPNRSRKWLFRKYWTYEDGRTIFSLSAKTKQGPRRYRVVRLGSIDIRGHRKIRAHANPYTREDAAYFAERGRDKEKRLLPGLTSRESPVLLAT
jgi:RNA-directed DNA polymerase